MIKAVLFDLWNTLAYNKTVDENPIISLELLLDLGVGDYRRIEEPLMTREFHSLEEAAKTLCKYLGKEPTPKLLEGIMRIWRVTASSFSFFTDVVRNINKLKAEGYRVGLISNTYSFSAGKLNKSYRDLFDTVVFSCETGILKPDAEMFRIALKRLGAKPQETLMVGDNLKDDVLAASNLGMKAVLIKREGKAVFKPSWTETGEYEKVITNLDEIWRLL